MNERLQKRLNELHMQAERAAASAEVLHRQANQAAITAAMERAKVQGAVELLGWSGYHFDGENIVEGPAVLPDEPTPEGTAPVKEDGTAKQRPA